jgi:hypothetical protein
MHEPTLRGIENMLLEENLTHVHRTILRDIVPVVLNDFVIAGNDYRNAHDLLGIKGQFSDINRKFWKLYNAIWLDQPLTREGVDQVVADIIGHCFLLLYHLNPGGDDGDVEYEPCDDCKDNEPEESGELRMTRDMNRKLKKEADYLARKLEKLERERGEALNKYEDVESHESGFSYRIAGEGARDVERPRSEPENASDDDALHQARRVYANVVTHLGVANVSWGVWFGICDSFGIDRTESPLWNR